MSSIRFTTLPSPLSNSRTIVHRMAVPRLDVSESRRFLVAASQPFLTASFNTCRFKKMPGISRVLTGSMTTVIPPDCAVFPHARDFSDTRCDALRAIAPA
jgi:hypothetical protein